VRGWIESEPTNAAILSRDWVNILKTLPFIHESSRILKAGGVLKSRHVAAKQARAASVEATYEHIFAGGLNVVLHNRIVFYRLFLNCRTRTHTYGCPCRFAESYFLSSVLL
jgi:hypothetical protein